MEGKIFCFWGEFLGLQVHLKGGMNGVNLNKSSPYFPSHFDHCFSWRFNSRYSTTHTIRVKTVRGFLFTFGRVMRRNSVYKICCKIYFRWNPTKCVHRCYRTRRWCRELVWVTYPAIIVCAFVIARDVTNELGSGISDDPVGNAD